MEQLALRRSGSGFLLAMATAIVFLSALSMFVLELAVAKALLPRFGGSPMVWTTCMMAYQVLLLAGYAYAHGLSRLSPSTRTIVLHGVLLTIAGIVALWRMRLPAFDDPHPAAAPLVDLLLTLGATMALPFLMLAAISPLVQHWLRHHNAQRPIYTLYAVSNIGSFVGLLSYPFIIEPAFDLHLQFRLLAALMIAVFAGLGGLMWVARQRTEARDTIATDPSPPPPRRDRILWIALPATTSALLLSATNELCQDLAVFPFLWVAPLSLYLLSYSVTFRTKPLPNLLAPAAVATLIGMGAASIGLVLPIFVLIVALSALVFVLSLAAHRELYRLRPPVGYLTQFYLWSAFGSVLGAVAVTFIPPLFFKGYWEFPSSVLAVWLILIITTALDADGCMRKGSRGHAAALLGLGLYLIINQIPENWLIRVVPAWPTNWSVPVRMAIAIMIALLFWPSVRRNLKPSSVLWPRVLAGLVVFMVESWLVQRIRNDHTGSVHISRNFFGVVRLQELVHHESGLAMRQLTHGRINHGFQYMNPNLLREPTAYHSPASGIGRVIRARQVQFDSIAIGVTGLGAGALAAYPRELDRIVFYEIDPQVVKAAYGDAAFFTFLNGCPGNVEVVLGDARQSMQREWSDTGSRHFDILALDAFSSDAVPTHLLTREAIGICLEHLSEQGGVLAVNISNRFLDLEPIMADSARHWGLHAAIIDTNGDPPVRARSIWVIMSRHPDIFAAPEVASVSRPLIPVEVAWTDRYSSPFALLKWWAPSARRAPAATEKGDGFNPLELIPGGKE